MASALASRNLFKRATAHNWFSIALALACALLIGEAIGQGKWLLLIGFTSLLLVLRWPVEIALGSFVLLVPFESSALADASGGKTLVWFVGASATCILLTTALLRRTLQRPPRAALWWTLLVLWCVITGLWASSRTEAVAVIPTAMSFLGLYLASVSFRLREREFCCIVGLAILGGMVVSRRFMLYTSSIVEFTAVQINRDRGTEVVEMGHCLVSV